MPHYQLHEPFPSLSSTRPTYMHTGRGGAGNTQRATATDVSARNPSSTARQPSTTSTASTKSNTFLTGRGGAGNAHPLSERALFSFDEELERASRMEDDAAPVYHIGRGGAGNYAQGRGSVAGSAASSRKGSSESEGSEGFGRRSLEWVRRLGGSGESGRA